MDYFKPNMTLADVNKISMLGLAHIGDGVYELMTRASLCEDGHTAVGELNHLATRRVNAPAQAAAVEKSCPFCLTRKARSTDADGIRMSIQSRMPRMSESIMPQQGWRRSSAGCICRERQSA